MRIPVLLSFALAALPALAFDTARVTQPAALAGVKQVYIAPATLDLPAAPSRLARAGEGPREVTPRDAQSKADDLTARLREGFARDFSVVDASAPGVLVVEATLTRLEASRPTMGDYQRVPGLSHESVFAGGAAVRLRLVRDGAEVAVIEDRYSGSFGDGTPRIGVWQDTDRAFTLWARQVPSWVAQPEAASR